MRQVRQLVLTLGVVALLVSPAFAQPPGGRGQFGGMFGGGGGIATLITNKGVQEEVKIEKEQVDKITEALKTYREDNKEDYEKARNRETDREERTALNKKLSAGSEKVIASVLKPEQMTRLKQISIQSSLKMMGPMVLTTNEDVQKALKLNDDQKDQVKTLVDDLQKDMREMFGGLGGGGRPDPEKLAEMTKKMEGVRKEAMKKVEALLTSDQKKSLEELTGKAFDLKLEPMGQRRPRPDPR